MDEVKYHKSFIEESQRQLHGYVTIILLSTNRVQLQAQENMTNFLLHKSFYRRRLGIVTRLAFIGQYLIVWASSPEQPHMGQV